MNKMKLSKPNIPKELDADVAMSVIIPHANSMADKELSYNYEFIGVSERTALGDDLSIAIRNRQNAVCRALALTAPMPSPLGKVDSIS